MTRALVTGVSGLLGINFSLQMCNRYKVIGAYHENRLANTPFDLVYADLSDEDSAFKLIEKTKPDIIINCAAMANLEKCEEAPAAARKINADLPGWFARISQQKGIKLVQISTDAVFDGLTGDYHESDEPNPLSVYAATKLAGERNVLQENSDAIIARVNFFGCSISGQRSLAEWFYNNLANQVQIMGFTDVFFCPLFVDDLADIIWQLVEKSFKGLYHVVSSEFISKYEFGIRIARAFDLDESLIKPSLLMKAGLKALRSRKLILRVDKIQSELGIQMPGQATGIRSFHTKVTHKFPEKLTRYLGK